VEWQDRKFATGIFKVPVKGPVRVETLGLEGDVQADRTVHGGKDKSVYAYPSEHYEYWNDQLQSSLRWGMFGENLTTEGVSRGIGAYWRLLPGRFGEIDRHATAVPML